MIATTCPYCGVGCGVLARIDADGAAIIEGDPRHPANLGRLCVKGAALGETVDLDGRLLYPQWRDQHGIRRRLSWDEALQRVAQGFQRVIAHDGADAVAFYVSGQLLTEDYYVVNKLAKGYLGTANIDTNSRLCMASASAGHKRAFGEDLLPGCYEDLELADLVVLAGSNAAWCHPVLFQRILDARRARPSMRLVVIDPRRTASCEAADLHLPLRPGSDVRLFNGLLAFLAARSLIDQRFVREHTQGLDAALAAARAEAADPLEVARHCDLPPQDLLAFYGMFADCERTVSLFSQGVNQSSSGTDKVNSLINCHLVSGRIGRSGMGPFSLTGQPNAMGGREVGGLANTLAAHMELDNPVHRDIVQRFWGSPRIAERAGLKAVELFEAIGRGQVKAVWIIGTNPLVSLPDAERVREALARCELVVVSDIVADTDTMAYADVLLPALGWGEKDGTVSNSERCISRQRRFLPPPGDARADWWMICEVARRMGFGKAFAFDGPAAIFDEHARLTAFANQSPSAESPLAARRVLDLGGLAGLSPAVYDTLSPRRWPLPAHGQTAPRLFGDGRFAHADGCARFVAIASRPPTHAPDQAYPLILNTGRVRDQWHTMTRTGKSPRLAGHRPEPTIDMHPLDAARHAVADGELARLSSRWGQMRARVRLDPGVLAGTVFAPIHWSGQVASHGRVGEVVNPAVDPISGEPEFKHTPVRVEAWPVAWHGFALSRQALLKDGLAYWVMLRGTGFLRYEIAGAQPLADCDAWARARLGVAGTDPDWLVYEDAAAGVYRAAHLVDGRLQACVFLAPRPNLPERHWLGGLFAQARLGAAERDSLLLGEPPGHAGEEGALVCACFGVGRVRIREAIHRHGLVSAAQITERLRAGGNCGSCVPELRQLLEEARS